MEPITQQACTILLFAYPLELSKGMLIIVIAFNLNYWAQLNQLNMEGDTLESAGVTTTLNFVEADFRTNYRCLQKLLKSSDISAFYVRIIISY
jgi:hypothetical protein